MDANGGSPPDDEESERDRSDEKDSGRNPSDPLPDPASFPQPIQAQVQHQNLSARVPSRVGEGVFANGVMVLTGQTEVVLDFVLRMGEQQRIVSRCVLPYLVARQFLMALRSNVENYEQRFGELPQLPVPKSDPSTGPVSEEREAEGSQAGGGNNPPHSGLGSPGHPENGNQSPAVPRIEDVYDELKADDQVYAGHYSNAVLIRHTGTEFCLDFITNLFPRSTVTSRIFLAAPHIRPLVGSLQRALQLPGSSEEMT
ncbi:DUF3467 domain-containing protein [Thalassoglobus sp. JC818]|uniref:DUF3467 domain-containing protein n=1 Tax=Thalassoglobus sp. JC818 TaxID=3232136 RepID=UPI003458F502